MSRRPPIRIPCRLALAACLAALLAAMAVVSASCGAEDVDAPLTLSGDTCPPLDDYLGGVYVLVDEGRLDTLSSVLEEQLTEDVRRDLIETAVRLVSALQPGAIVALGDVRKDVQDTAALQDLLADVAFWLTDVGTEAPYTHALEVGRQVIGTCEGPPALQLVLDLLHDDTLLAALADVLAVDLDIEAIVDRLDSPDGEPRTAIRILARNALVAATDPQFDVSEWTGLLGLLVDTSQPPWTGLIDALQGLLGPGPTLVRLQGLVECLLVVDPELATIDLVYDLLVASPSRRLDRAPLTDAIAGSGPLLPPEIDAPLTDVIEHLIDHEADRCTLVAVVGAMLGPGLAADVVREFGWLLKSHALLDVIDGLVALARRGCEP